MVGHYLGVDPGREDDWKSPARREDLKAIWDLTEDFWEVGVHINEGKYGETYPKFCIGFKIRKSRSEQLLLSGSGHSK